MSDSREVDEFRFELGTVNPVSTSATNVQRSLRTPYRDELLPPSWWTNKNNEFHQPLRQRFFCCNYY